MTSGFSEVRGSRVRSSISNTSSCRTVRAQIDWDRGVSLWSKPSSALNHWRSPSRSEISETGMPQTSDATFTRSVELGLGGRVEDVVAGQRGMPARLDPNASVDHAPCRPFSSHRPHSDAATGTGCPDDFRIRFDSSSRGGLRGAAPRPVNGAAREAPKPVPARSNRSTTSRGGSKRTAISIVPRRRRVEGTVGGSLVFVRSGSDHSAGAYFRSGPGCFSAGIVIRT